MRWEFFDPIFCYENVMTACMIESAVLYVYLASSKLLKRPFLMFVCNRVLKTETENSIYKNIREIIIDWTHFYNVIYIVSNTYQCISNAKRIEMVKHVTRVYIIISKVKE